MNSFLRFIKHHHAAKTDHLRLLQLIQANSLKSPQKKNQESEERDLHWLTKQSDSLIHMFTSTQLHLIAIQLYTNTQLCCKLITKYGLEC